MIVKRFDSSSLHTASTARTYSVGTEELRSAVKEAVGRLPRWTLVSSSEGDIQAIRKTRFLGFEDDITVRFTAQSLNVRVELESTSRVGVWDIGQNRRNLREMIEAIDQELQVRIGDDFTARE